MSQLRRCPSSAHTPVSLIIVLRRRHMPSGAVCRTLSSTTEKTTQPSTAAAAQPTTGETGQPPPPSSDSSSPTTKTTSTTTTTTTYPPARRWHQRLWDQWEESSGQKELDKLKHHVRRSSEQFDTATESVSSHRSALEKAQHEHDMAHNRHASLMMRRDSWDTNDASTFVSVTAREVSTRRDLQKARDDLRSAEEYASKCQRDYMDVMRRRYHEEQIWQERWRLLGTYGTWCLIGLNTVVFLGSQLFHYRREAVRLKAVEDLIADGMQSMERAIYSSSSSPSGSITSAGHQVAAGDGVTKGEGGVATTATTDVSMSSENGDIGTRVDGERECKDDTDDDGSAEPRSYSTEEEGSIDIQWRDALKKRELSKLFAYLNRTMKNGVRHRVNEMNKEIHGPSVALGAVASAALILLISSSTGRR